MPPKAWCDCADPDCFCPGGGLKHRTTTTDLFKRLPTSTPVTATTKPSRTVLVRVSTPTVQAHANEAKSDASAEFDPQRVLKKPQRDITSTFYHQQLFGDDANMLPLIVEHPVAPGCKDTEPITLLAAARTQFFSSFISSSLVADLNLTASIRPVDTKPIFLSERDLSTLLGYDTHPMGLLTLRLLAGREDKAHEADFTVAHAPEDKEGTWYPDLVVGMQFLSDLQALEFTAEFGGCSETGARDGLGVLVQRVFREEKDGEGGVVGHDEL